MFALVQWDDPKSARLVLDEEGGVRLFETHSEAEGFAEPELSFNWMVIEL